MRNEPLNVVAAAIVRGGRVLIAQRPDHLHQGGKWEFPGGKIEPQELPEEALSRELNEELGVTITSYHPLLSLHHDYADKSIALDVWLVSDFRGIPRGNEGQVIRWIDISELTDYDFPDANQAIIQMLIQQTSDASISV